MQSTYGIIGYPVKHSLSPLMQNVAFKELGVDAVYKLFPLREEELDPFFAGLRDKNSPIFGLNVTVPYKEKVMEYLDSLSPFAKKAMSVNTICISRDRKLKGYNTDGPGFLAHLAELSFSVRDKRIAILGAGGTARAIMAALCLLPEQPESIRVYNRTALRAQQLIVDLGQRIDVSRVESVSSIDDLNIEVADLLINTTSVGLSQGDSCLVDDGLLHPHLLVYDVVYSPEETILLKLAKAKGARTANGLGMLFYQGVMAFQHWAEIELEEEIKQKMRESLAFASPRRG